MKQPAKSPSLQKAGDNRLRIIGGQWRGRKLAFPDVEGLRPTGDRIRETLFNWLAPEIVGARCLDIFAGSGALGIEALSRGADYCLMVERDRQATSALRNNLALLNCSRAAVRDDDALAFIAKGNSEPAYDVVFIDPPFALSAWPKVIDSLVQGQWLAANATIYIEAPIDYPLMAPADWSLHRDKRAGKVAYRLYYRNAEA